MGEWCRGGKVIGSTSKRRKRLLFSPTLYSLRASDSWSAQSLVCAHSSHNYLFLYTYPVASHKVFASFYSQTWTDDYYRQDLFFHSSRFQRWPPSKITHNPLYCTCKKIPPFSKNDTFFWAIGVLFVTLHFKIIGHRAASVHLCICVWMYSYCVRTLCSPAARPAREGVCDECVERCRFSEPDV